jgi:ubiquinone/menaquinone biosynthesis C-methylase UbiE
MVKGMNSGAHAKLANWGMDHLHIRKEEFILDAGCGGGANGKRHLEKAPEGHVIGLDYSPVSVNEASKVNKKAIKEGICEIIQADVGVLPFKENSFNMVTAFETIYFWPDLKETFKGIKKVLKEEVVFMICNESNGHDETAVKFSKIIEGMTLYDAKILKRYLKEAGFHDVITDQKGIWLVMIVKT